MNLRPLLLPVLGLLLLAPPPGLASGEEASDLEKLGDALQILLPAGGFLSTFVAGNGEGGRWDKQGSWQSLVGFAGSWTITYGLKTSVAKLRPNRHARNSWPSGHTMGAFAGASFIDRRYGRTFGIPAYALATLTGYSRVDSDWHFADDVVAGASVSLLWTSAVANPQPWNVNLRPWFGGEATGMLLSIGGAERPDPSAFDEPAPWRYEWAFGPAALRKNEITSPSGEGDRFDLATFEKIDDPTTTSTFTLSRGLGDRNRVAVSYGPFESRDDGRFATPTEFQGVTFPADTLLNSAYRLHDLRGMWMHDLVRGPWTVTAGAGLMAQFTHFDLQVQGDSVNVAVDDFAMLPLVGFEVLRSLGGNFEIGLYASGMVFPEDWVADTGLELVWRFHPRWELLGGYHYYDREISTGDLRNRVAYDIPYLAVGRSW